jgi:hypothetical protein
MAQKNSSENKVKDLMQNYKQNLQGFAKATKVAGETVKNLTQMQNKFMQESLQNMNGIATEIMTAQPIQRAAISQKALSQGLNRAVAHSNAVLQALTQPATDWFEQQDRQSKQSAKSAS